MKLSLTSISKLLFTLVKNCVLLQRGMSSQARNWLRAWVRTPRVLALPWSVSLIPLSLTFQAATLQGTLPTRTDTPAWKLAQETRSCLSPWSWWESTPKGPPLMSGLPTSQTVKPSTTVVLTRRATPASLSFLKSSRFTRSTSSSTCKSRWWSWWPGQTLSAKPWFWDANTECVVHLLD